MTETDNNVLLLPPPKAVESPAVPAVVAILERLLDEAKRGEIIGISYAMVRPAHLVSKGRTWEKTNRSVSNDLMAATADLMFEMQDERASFYEDAPPLPDGLRDDT